MKKIFLIILGVLLASLIGEITLRMSNSYALSLDEKTKLITLKPNKEYLVKKCFKNYVKVNSLGFHDFELEEEKPEDVFRIAVLGDSFVEALQVPREKSFHNLLEKKLNEELGGDKKFEVYAFARGGNGTFNNNLYLKEYALRYKPDLVIDTFFYNDVFDDSCELQNEHAISRMIYWPTFCPKFDDKGNIDFPAIEAKLSDRPPTRLIIINSVFKSALARWLFYQYQIRIKNLLGRLWLGDSEIFLVDYPEIWQKAWQDEELLLKSMRNLSSEAGAKFLLVHMVNTTNEEYIIPKQLRGFQVDINKPEKLLEEISQRNQFPFLSLQPILKEDLPIHFSCDVHFNEAGHQLAAQAIFEYLKNHPELLSL